MPAEHPSDEHQDVLLIHGTFAGREEEVGPAWWQRGSRFCARLQEKLGPGYTCQPEGRVFRWSKGPNLESRRRLAGAELLDHLWEHFERDGRERPYHLVAHSHGGSVVWHALRESVRRRKPLRNLASWTTAGAPFMRFSPERKGWSFLLPAVAAGVGFAAALPHLAFVGARLVANRGALAPDGLTLELLGAPAFAVGSLVCLVFAGARTLAWLKAAFRSWRYRRLGEKAARLYGDRAAVLACDQDEAINGLATTVGWESDVVPRRTGGWWAAVFNRALAPLADEFVVSQLARRFHGNDISGEELRELRPSPHVPTIPIHRPAGLCESLVDSANSAAAESLAEFRAVLGRSEAGGLLLPDVFRVFEEERDDKPLDELVHTAYFESVEFADLVAARIRGGALPATSRAASATAPRPARARLRGLAAVGLALLGLGFWRLEGFFAERTLRPLTNARLAEAAVAAAPLKRASAAATAAWIEALLRAGRIEDLEQGLASPGLEDVRADSLFELGQALDARGLPAGPAYEAAWERYRTADPAHMSGLVRVALTELAAAAVAVGRTDIGEEILRQESGRPGDREVILWPYVEIGLLPLADFERIALESRIIRQRREFGEVSAWREMGLRYELARFLASKGRWHRALEMADELAAEPLPELEPEDLRATEAPRDEEQLSLLVAIYDAQTRAGDTAASKETLERALRHAAAPVRDGVRSGLARSLARSGEREAARSVLGRMERYRFDVLLELLRTADTAEEAGKVLEALLRERVSGPSSRPEKICGELAHFEERFETSFTPSADELREQLFATEGRSVRDRVARRMTFIRVTTALRNERTERYPELARLVFALDDGVTQDDPDHRHVAMILAERLAAAGRVDEAMGLARLLGEYVSSTKIAATDIWWRDGGLSREGEWVDDASESLTYARFGRLYLEAGEPRRALELTELTREPERTALLRELALGTDLTEPALERLDERGRAEVLAEMAVATAERTRRPADVREAGEAAAALEDERRRSALLRRIAALHVERRDFASALATCGPVSCQPDDAVEISTRIVDACAATRCDERPWAPWPTADLFAWM